MNQAEFFDSYAERWDAMELPDMPSRVARVAKLARIPWGGCVLDVGTGTGVMIPSLAKAVGPSGVVVAIDVSIGMLTQAAKKLFFKDVHLIRANAETPSFQSQAFDSVICNAVFPHFTDECLTTARLIDLLRPGGSLIVSHPIGREAVNRIHQHAGGGVSEDIVPPPSQMCSFLTQLGLEGVWVCDEPEFYLAFGTRETECQTDG